MPDSASDLARRLAENAEAVCRHYLSNGRRQGGYWLAGDVLNAPGRSLYVRLHGPASGRGAAGRWTDAATGQRGDLLDLIGAARQLRTTGDALHEASRFLGVARHMPAPSPSLPGSSPQAASRLFAMARPIAGTLAEAYLRTRGIGLQPGDEAALRFHPHCYYRDPGDAEASVVRTAWPALIAAVTDLDGALAGLHRTWLDPAGGKAPVATPRRAMGSLLGHAVRFGAANPTDARSDVMAAGEGIETVLSLRSALPALPLAAALSAAHLASLLPSPRLRRLYIARDRDDAGQWAADRLASRMHAAGIEAIVLTPNLGDFNDDLRRCGPRAFADMLRVQLAPEDVARFWRAPERCGRMR